MEMDGKVDKYICCVDVALLGFPSAADSVASQPRPGFTWGEMSFQTPITTNNGPLALPWQGLLLWPVDSNSLYSGR